MQNQQQPPNAAPYQAPHPAPHIVPLTRNRSLLKYILLSIVTFGIYSIVFMSVISTDINTIASRYDNRHTMHYCLIFFLLGPITLGIMTIVWTHMLCNRIGRELQRRNMGYNFDASTFWLWGVLGAFIIVGPFIYLHKMCVAMTKLQESYNYYG
jgi:uncharacterized membrane protein